MAEGRHVEHVQVVPARGHEVGHRVVRRGLVHRGLGRRRIDVFLDFGGELREPVHGEDLLLDFLLVIGDAAVRIDLDDVEVGDDGDEAFAEDVPIKDIAEARLGIGRKTEDVPLPL